MSTDKVDLFVKLVKLKSYLVSMIDNYDESPESLYHTEEFLNLRYPDDKEEILTLLKENKILSDREIVFDTQMHMKFKNIAEGMPKGVTLESIFDQVGITSDEFESIKSFLNSYRSKREEELKNIVETLLQLARLWVNHLEIENSADDLLALHEEDVIRPEENKAMEDVSKNSESSLMKLTAITNKYLDMLSNYYFNYGGDIQLKSFLFDLEKFIKNIEAKYKKLLDEED
jgi:hypothetical protein